MDDNIQRKVASIQHQLAELRQQVDTVHQKVEQTQSQVEAIHGLIQLIDAPVIIGFRYLMLIVYILTTPFRWGIRGGRRIKQISNKLLRLGPWLVLYWLCFTWLVLRDWWETKRLDNARRSRLISELPKKSQPTE